MKPLPPRTRVVVTKHGVLSADLGPSVPAGTILFVRERYIGNGVHAGDDDQPWCRYGLVPVLPQEVTRETVGVSLKREEFTPVDDI